MSIDWNTLKVGDRVRVRNGPWLTVDRITPAALWLMGDHGSYVEPGLTPYDLVRSYTPGVMA